MLNWVRCAFLLALLSGMTSAQQPAPRQDAEPEAVAQDQLPSAPSPQNNVPNPLPPPRPAAPAPAPPPDDNAQVPPPQSNERDQMMYTLRTNVNFVVVPVTVKDENGHLVEGLTRKDFSVYEDGVSQQLRFFTSDPFPLSAAVVLDVGLPDRVLQKVNDTLPVLAGAFSQFDEVAIFTYGSSVEKAHDFSAVTDRYSTAIRRMRRQGQASTAPVVGGPLGQPSPTVNGQPIDPNVPHGGVYVNTHEPHVLNDAVLAAALELSKRPKDRRKVIFVISDGKEERSRANYQQVKKVLLSNSISVYAVAVGDSALPLVRTIERVNLPHTGYGDLLPRYAGDTGGDVFPELDRNAIEAAYNRVTEQARNQYTLGYNAKSSGPGNQYRSIEVRVHRPNLKVRAKDGYYPLPIAPSL